MPRVLGGQAFRPSSFPPTKYIDSLIRAYCPELQGAFEQDAFLEAFNKARTSEFDKEFSKVTKDGVNNGLQLCWCLLDIESGLTLPLHAHKNLELAYVLKGVMKERSVSSRIDLDRLKPAVVDWLDIPASAKVVDASFAAGECWLGLPGSVHQIYTAKGGEGCMLLMLYSKDCTFIRAASPLISRQLLPATADKGTTYHMTPTVRSPASFSARDPVYAKYRRSGSLRPQSMTVAQVAVKALADCGVRDTILYPGAKCVELLKVVDSNVWGVRGWLCRNEHAGAFMAEAYNKSQTERLCAIMTTSGPGATNLCTGIASAWRDGVPMIIITSQVPTYKLGTAAFQEVPVVELFKPITKGAFYVSSASQVYDTIVSACRLAVEGVNGPVVVDIPEDLQAEQVTLPERSRLQDLGPEFTNPPAPVQPGSPGVASRATVPLHASNRSVLAPSVHSLRSHVACPISQSLMKKVLLLIKDSHRPLLLLGGGAVRVDAALLNELVDVLDMPVVYTWMGKGCISDDHELCLGPIGVHGLHTANAAVGRCDMLLALGCRFDERSACKAFELWGSPRPVVHVDIAPQASMSGSPKNVIGCSVEADCEDFVGVLLQHLYGFIEDRRKTFAVNTGRSLELLESRGSCKVTELDDLQAFLAADVDLAQLARLRRAYGDKDGSAAEGEPEGAETPKKHDQELTEGDSFSFKQRPDAATAAGETGEAIGNGSGGCFAGDYAANGTDGSFSLQGATSPPSALAADFSGSDWHMYSEWSREMSEMKQRRWRSMMPISSAQSELTTREMVHVTDSFLSLRGLQPIICSDVGSHQCLLAQYMRVHHPRQWLIEGGLASMGCGLPAAIGAALANPQATCLAICGDGGFAMTSQELMMAKVYKLNVKVIVTVNNRLQLVEQLEEEAFDSLDVFTFLGDPDHPNRPYPNFAKVAEAYGVRSVTAWNRQEVLDGLSLMFAHPGPFLLEVVALAERPHIRYWTDDEQ